MANSYASSSSPTGLSNVKWLLVYLPGVLPGLVGIWFTCITLELPDSILPFRRPLTPMEDIFEMRGLFGDSCVILLAHLVVFMSNEWHVQATVKLAASMYCYRLIFLLPNRFIRLAEESGTTIHGEDYGNVIVQDMFETNRIVLFVLGSLHALGAVLLYNGRSPQEESQGRRHVIKDDPKYQ